MARSQVHSHRLLIQAAIQPKQIMEFHAAEAHFADNHRIIDYSGGYVAALFQCCSGTDWSSGILATVRVFSSKNVRVSEQDKER